jgi:hypothetical protein
MTKSEKQSWEQERAKGYDHFLLRSLFRAGLPYGILMTLAHILWPYFRHRPVSPIWQLIVEFGLCVLFFGAWMGVCSWRSNERDYTKPTEDEDLA